MNALSDVVEQALPRLRAVSEERAASKPGGKVWSAGQVLCHLIDSSVNNHARFVRAGAENGLALPGYDQNVWAAAGGYQQYPWTELVTLWTAYQTQFAHVIGGLTPEQRAHTLSIGGEAVTLGFVATDDVRHQPHHLAQVWERAEA
ncbi:DinB family protein [Deinococcus sp.]|uniref:DinB family protein n=1 Tax=Deinococcus sp. TaxID=47478 RepID=UPI00286DD916|nr:DinB family protein [Deinococcus sp.]